MTVATTPAVAHRLISTKSTREFAVTGAPDTRGPGKGSITVRPEKVRLTFYDGKLRWVALWGRTIRRDQSVSLYREVGFSSFGYRHDGQDHEYDTLPDWVADILAAEGVVWPAGEDVYRQVEAPDADTLEKLRPLLPDPCPVPDFQHGYDMCSHGAWPCKETIAAWLVRGLDPEAEKTRVVAEHRARHLPVDDYDSKDGSW